MKLNLSLFVKASFALYCVLFLIVPPIANAQLLEKSAQKILSLKNLRYIDIVQTKFSFQDDYYADTIKSEVIIKGRSKSDEGYFYLKAKDATYAFDGNKLVVLYLKDSTYIVEKESVNGQNTRTILYWAKQMAKLSKSIPNKVKQLGDTTINNIPYHNIRITQTDTIINKASSYSIYNFIVDKKNGLPVYITHKFLGEADDGSAFGLVETHTYSNYTLNQKQFSDLSTASIPNYFKPPAKRKPVQFLENGVAAPTLIANDADGKKLNIDELKGKTVLINFSLIGCPHCVGAAQMLNRLNEKYKDKNVVIINVYPIDKTDVIAKFDQKQNVKTISYTSDRSVQINYPFDGYPSFYLIDKEGNIADSYNGFYKELETKIMQKIERIL
ncbi:TlpA disulfide reductase family protein [Pedobacter psychrodurus]|uniref:TlpA family protein disulfide reductase n=1 Tax=Pedobacter psychrodurus TaxID=2530456 RepID=UPI0029305D49|nr:TlpA disulfide reductase family protein [Pedobacter psychrodurus]